MFELPKKEPETFAWNMALKQGPGLAWQGIELALKK